MERSHDSSALARRPGAAPAADADASLSLSSRELFTLVYRQMRSLAGRRDVDELAQEAAAQALRGLPSFAGRSSLSTWTFRICYLTVRKHDRWYRRWLRRFTLTDDGELPETSPAAALESASALPEQRLVEGERLARVHAALAELSPKRRTVLVLHDLEDVPIDEIAEIVAAQPRAVRSRLRDGRRALAEILARDPYFGDEACRRKGTP